MGALAMKTMEIVAAGIDDPHLGRRGAMCGAGKRQTHDPAGRVTAIDQRRKRRREILVELPIIRVIFAKQKQKAPESVRTSGIALRRLWALRSYNRPAGLWFQLTKSNSGAG